jgi:nitrogen fixation NifU-like protein|tara:strand:- start:466 stop:864 length:399 start_codon:yes stop_codon:yes gene_type:complete
MNLKILQIASNTKNNKIVKNHTHNTKLKNPICGDEMLISIKVVKNNIVDFGYQGKSCVYCQASASLLSRNSINKSIIHVKNLLKISVTFFEKEKVIFPEEWSVFNKIFNKKNISRKECLLLPFKTLMKALKS